MTLIKRSFIGRGTDAATVTLPFGVEVTYYDNGEWGTVHIGRKLRIGWSWKKARTGRRPECREIYVTRNGTPWGIPRRFGRVLYVGRVGEKLRIFPDAEEYAQWRYLRSYAEMRGWVKRPETDDD